MDGIDITALSAATVLIVQNLKWAGLSRHYAGLVTAITAAACTGVWAWSEQNGFGQANAFTLLASWAAVWAAAVGVFKVAKKEERVTG